MISQYPKYTYCCTESIGLHVGIAKFLPLRSHLAPFLSSLTSGMEEIVMHERYHDMQLTY